MRCCGPKSAGVEFGVEYIKAGFGGVMQTVPVLETRRDVLWECYDALFEGIPRGLLGSWARFEWGHDTPALRIDSLAAFRDNFAGVMGLFQAHDFAEEYRDRYPREHGEGGAFEDIPAPQAAESRAECEARLRALWSAIVSVGDGEVERKVRELFAANADEAQRLSAIRGYVLWTGLKAQEHRRGGGQAAPGRRGARMGARMPATAEMWGLLGRLRELAA